jgi:O-antigen ligase
MRLRPSFQQGILIANLLATLFVIQVAAGIGAAAAFFLVILMVSVVGGLAHPRAFALLILTLAPIPSVEQLLGVSARAGLDIVNILVVFALGMAITRALHFPLLDERLVIAVTVLNFGLLLIAWYRGYVGQSGAFGSLTLVLHPAVVFVAGVLVVQLLDPHSATEWVGLGMAGMLVVVGVSSLAQAIGLYTPAGLAAGVKVNGGIMLQGNEAAALFSTFAVPAFVLLRAVGRHRLGVALLLFSLPVLLVTQSRTSLIILPLSLLALAIFDRRAQTARVVAGVAILGVIYVGTVGRSSTQQIIQSLTQHSLGSNQTLSGRPYLWNKAIEFLDLDSHWLYGGGLNAFERFTALDPKLSNAGFTTHNVWLRQLVNGGVLMAIGYLVFLLGLWRLSKKTSSPPAIALRVALVATILLGLTKDLNPFDRGGAWLWTLAALAALPAAATAPVQTAVAPLGIWGQRLLGTGSSATQLPVRGS